MNVYPYCIRKDKLWRKVKGRGLLLLVPRDGRERRETEVGQDDIQALVFNLPHIPLQG